MMRSGAVYIELSDPIRDQAALRSLARWSTRFAPIVAPDLGDGSETFPAWGLFADITGCQRLYRGETNLLRQWLIAVRRLGFQARIASAPTFGCAWAVARFGRDDLTVIDDTGVVEAIAILPIRGLRIDYHTEAALAQVGVQTIGQLMKLPRRSLPSRFGDDLIRRMDQALGHVFETLDPVRVTPPLRVTQVFAGPVKRLEVIERAARQGLDALCDRLVQHASGARHIQVTLARSDCQPVTIDITTSRLGRHAKHLWSLLHPKLERAHLGFGVEAMTLTARRVDRMPYPPIDHPALGRVHHDENLEHQFGQVIDLLASRLGASAVTRIEPVASHIPERAYRHVDPTKVVEAVPVVDADRPFMLWGEPEPIEVMAVTPDGPLVQLHWHGQVLRILTSIGPERIASQWWSDGELANATRDYFKVQDETGRWWWVYRHMETHQWFIHGRWT